MCKTEKYHFFYGQKSQFSQWFKCYFLIDNKLFNCTEQWMMYSKAILFDDLEISNQILESNSPREYKQFGRKVKNFDEIIWNNNAKEIVYIGNYAKFSQNKHLRKILLSTENKILVEANPNDIIWGIGMSENDPNIYNSKNWKGTNWLGEVLMRVRKDLKMSQDDLS